MKYSVALPVIWVTEVEANSAEEAANLAIEKCSYDLENSVPINVWDEANRNWFLWPYEI